MFATDSVKKLFKVLPEKVTLAKTKRMNIDLGVFEDQRDDCESVNSTKTELN